MKEDENDVVASVEKVKDDIKRRADLEVQRRGADLTADARIIRKRCRWRLTAVTEG